MDQKEYDQIIQVAENVGPNTLGRLRSSLSSAGYKVNFTQNNKVVVDASEGSKPPSTILTSVEKTGKHKKIQRAPTSGMYVKMKQRPASSKPPIIGNFSHQGNNDYSGSIIVSNLVKQHKLDMQSSERVPSHQFSRHTTADQKDTKGYSEN